MPVTENLIPETWHPKPHASCLAPRASRLAPLCLFAACLVLFVAADWPTYQHDEARSGTTSEQLDLPLEEAWRFESQLPPAPAWPAPAKQDFWHRKQDLPARVTYDRAFHVVTDGQRAFFGSSADDQVRALDMRTGKQLWNFFAQGPVRLAPTLYEGRVYFGSDDGWVYCLAAETGELHWRYRRSGADRRIAGNGRIISVWPVRSGVLVREGQVRFASGLFPLQGTFQHVVDAKSGERLAEGPIEFSPQGYLQTVGTRLMIPQGRAKPVPLAELSSGAEPGEALSPVAEYPYAMIRAGEMRFAGGEDQVVAISDSNDVVWSAECAGRVYSLAVANGNLLASSDRGVIHCFRRPQPAVALDVARPPATRSELGRRQSSLVTQLLKQSSTARGYALVLGDQAAGVGAELARRSAWRVVGVMSDHEQLARHRQELAREGLYGRVALEQFEESDRLPFASGLFNLVVLLPEGPPKLSPGEVGRLLVPGRGLAVVLPSPSEATGSLAGWTGQLEEYEFVEDDSWGLLVRRRPLPGVGEWTHIYGKPDNRACSDDQLVAGGLQLQWFGRPGPRNMLDRHHRTIPPLVTDGRLFVPGDDRVFALDAYNGTPLWDAEVSNFRRVGAMRDAGSMAAAADYLYLAAGDRCYGLDSKTGNFTLNFPVPTAADREWGYMARVDDRLFGSTTRVGASRDQHSREQIFETYFDGVPIVTSDMIFCLDRHSGEHHWSYSSEAGAIINPTITIAEERVYFIRSKNRSTLTEPSGRSTLPDLLQSGAELVALNTLDGGIAWSKAIDLREVEHHLYLCHAEGKLVAVGSKNKHETSDAFVWYDLHAFEASSGEHLWSATQNQRQGVNGDHGEQDHHPVIVDGRVYQEPFAYDLNSGERIQDWQFQRGGHGCGTISASASTFFFRAGNPTMCDLATGLNQKVTAVSRPGCWINMIPAGGMLLIPEASSGCTCDFPIQSSIALASPALGE